MSIYNSSDAETLATITVGAVYTGDPGSNAQVINSGTAENAVLDFVIPRGNPGTAGAPDIISSAADASQSPAAGNALVFCATALVSGTAVTHQAGSTDVAIHQPGIYLALFHGTVSVNTETPVPRDVTVQLCLNGDAVPGSVVRHTLISPCEQVPLSIQAVFQVTDTPSAIAAAVSNGGFTFTDLNLIIIKLGE